MTAIVSEIRELEFRFTAAHMRAFAAVSQDRHPIHTDPEYAGRAVFGRPVVYGVGAVLAGLGAWARGRAFGLDTLRARFLRPLFPEEPQILRVTAREPEVELQVGPDAEPRVVVNFTWRERIAGGAASSKADAAFQPRAIANDWEAVEDGVTPLPDPLPYAPDWSAAAEFAREFGLAPGAMPQGQLTALLWSSYFIGMEMPGRQALFNYLAFDFEGTDEPVAFAIQGAEADYDSRFNLMTVNGRGSGIRSFQLKALWRPRPEG